MTPDTTQFFVIAGEKSASIYGAKLIKQLRQHNPAASFYGCGGDDMLAAGLHEIVPFSAFQVMGIGSVICKLPRLITSFYKLKNTILKMNPCCVIFIDQPSFSLRLAHALRKQGFEGKIVQYVAPTVWAYKRKRIIELENNFDLLLTLFPFEAEYFKESKLHCIFCGHPLANINQQSVTDTLRIQYPIADKKILALFPGSRLSEIKSNLGVMLETGASFEGMLAISLAAEEYRPIILNLIKKHQIPLEKIIIVPFEERYLLMKQASLAIAKSGTVTLELALFGVPTVVIYSLSLLNFLVAKYIFRLKLPFYCIVNILYGKEIFPECIGYKLSVEKIKNKMTCVHQIAPELQQLPQMLTAQEALASHTIMEILE